MTHLSLIFTSRSWSAPGHLLNQPGVPVPAPSSLLKSTQYDCYSDSKWLWVCIFVTGPYLHLLWARDTHTQVCFPPSHTQAHTDTHTQAHAHTWNMSQSRLFTKQLLYVPDWGDFQTKRKAKQSYCAFVFHFYHLKLISRPCLHFCMIVGPIWTTFAKHISILFIIQNQSWQIKSRVIGFDAFGAILRSCEYPRYAYTPSLIELCSKFKFCFSSDFSTCPSLHSMV